ncbi:30S ribosomal protein S8 [Patescibacteria group bacterium]|nr:30S ribosomal protein S8 [Patescibacteria group bacterium]
MVVTDPIADFLIRIKNAYLVKKKLVEMPWSKMKGKMAEMLVKEGFLKSAKVKSEKFKTLELELKYEGKRPAITEVKRISKPGVRIYEKVNKIPKVRQGVGITIISTPQGLMTDKQARKNHQGGEVICQIW